MDPITTPLLVLVLGNLAHKLIAGACKDYFNDKLKSLFSKAAKLGSKDDLQLAYEGAMAQAYESCCEVLLRNIETFGERRSELPHYRESLRAFIKDPDVAAELFRSIQDPNDQTAPSPEILKDRWQAIGGRKLPSDQLWSVTSLAYRNKALQQSFLSDPLREILLGKNVDRLLKEVQQQGGVQVQVRLDKYLQRMRTKFSPVDLANLMPAYADDPGSMVIRDVFVAQDVRENPPAVEIPKDLAEQQLEKLGAAYVSQSPKPVLDVIAAAGNRLLVLTGEPGSGKSMLMRYLLTGIIESPIDRESGEPLPWTLAFKDAFPLLIELRDFYALRCSDECDNFLEYFHCMGKNDRWFLDQHAISDYLASGPSLVMFDGLDEIFDTADRERVMREIAGFAQQYQNARIIVTSRPVGYKEEVLRDAGFAHFGIQDLDDGHIETFIRGWFALTFPQRPQQANQRTERVLGSVRQSKPIRLLAGNPMLLTIMALLAREEELGRERAKFYEKAVEVLCHHWDANRALAFYPELRGEVDLRAKTAILRSVAFTMQNGPHGLAGNIIDGETLTTLIEDYLREELHFEPPRAAARAVARQLRERNFILCLRGPHLYGFVHRTFLEYLTAAEVVHRFHVAKTLDLDGLIAEFDRHCRDDDWCEVLHLICAQIDESFVERIVEHLATRTNLEKWDGETPLPELRLAVQCLSEVRNPYKVLQAGKTIHYKAVKMLRDATRPWNDFVREFAAAVTALGAYWPNLSAVVRAYTKPKQTLDPIKTEPPVDFVIVTALEEEFEAVLAQIPNHRRLPPSEADIRVYTAASIPVTFSDGATGRYSAILLPLLSMGRLDAAHATSDAIRRWRPRYVVLVGIAGGISSQGVSLGDLLVPDQVVDYELQKITAEGSEIRWRVHSVDPRLLGAAKYFQLDGWHSRVKVECPSPTAVPVRRIGPIATGDKVVAFKEVLQRYSSQWPKLVGVEMEAGGAVSACFQANQPPGFFMVRAVSDLADKDKDSPSVSNWRSYACHVAAAYAIALLEAGPVTARET